jgi:hypothetical protein
MQRDGAIADATWVLFERFASCCERKWRRCATLTPRATSLPLMRSSGPRFTFAPADARILADHCGDALRARGDDDSRAWRCTVVRNALARLSCPQAPPRAAARYRLLKAPASRHRWPKFDQSERLPANGSKGYARHAIVTTGPEPRGRPDVKAFAAHG